jgi:hypothetical protein
MYIDYINSSGFLHSYLITFYNRDVCVSVSLLFEKNLFLFPIRQQHIKDNFLEACLYWLFIYAGNPHGDGLLEYIIVAKACNQFLSHH